MTLNKFGTDHLLIITKIIIIIIIKLLLLLLSAINETIILNVLGDTEGHVSVS